MTQLDLLGNEQGKEMLKAAMKWRNNNLHAWSQMHSIAARFASEGKRFSIDYLANEARYFMRAQGDERGFKVNNTDRAPLARLMIQENPTLKDFIETRKSKVDTWMS